MTSARSAGEPRASRRALDAVVVGAGPNGLAAAVELARAGRSVRVLEANDTWGGGARTLELTLPGFRHDPCSAIHPLAVASPAFRRWPLERHGLEWIDPPAALAHPLDDQPAALLLPDIGETAEHLGRDGEAWSRLFSPLADAWDELAEMLLGPPRLPRHPFLAARFGLAALPPAASFARRSFSGARARALFAGCAAHSILPLEAWGSSAFGTMLALLGHVVGWPLPRGGAGSIADALVSHLRELGGEVELGRRVRREADLPAARAVLFDTSPAAALAIAERRVRPGARSALERFRHGPGVVKVDWALAGPVPWSDPACSRAATVHVGGPLDEIAASEAAPWHGRVPGSPFVLFAQPSLFDESRAPEGRHVGWGYCHVPSAWRGDADAVADSIERQVERFAPGFRELVLARSVMGPAALESSNANLVGGDVGGGSNELRQLLIRPHASLDPYRLGPGTYLCSASTPPGGGVHGLCGMHAARSALRHELR